MYLEPGDVDWINLANFCQTFHCLPIPGGAFDQDPVTVEVFNTVTDAQAEHARREAKNAR